MFPYFEIFGRTIGMYGIVTIIGIFLASIIIYNINKKNGFNIDSVIMGGLSSLIGLFIGAHALFGITMFPNLIDFILNRWNELHSFKDFLNLMNDTFGGMVFYGGLFGGLIGLLLYCHFAKRPRRTWFNAFIPGFALIHAFGRIGCFLGGCCYGIPYDGPFAVTFPADAIIGHANSDIADCSRFPIQLLESGLEFILCIILFILVKKYKDRFCLTKIYLFTYAIIRFSDEFLRGDYLRGFWGPFSTSQWISLIIIFVLVILFIRKQILKKKI